MALGAVSEVAIIMYADVEENASFSKTGEFPATHICRFRKIGFWGGEV